MTDRSGKRLKDNSFWWTLFYLALGSSWILASDLWLFRSEENPGYRIISIAKGLAYVLITAILLYAMMRQNSSSFRKVARSLLESETRLRRIFDTTEEGLVVIDSNFKICDVNQRMCGMVALPSDQIVGNDFLTLVSLSSKDSFRSRILDSAGDSRNVMDIELVAKDQTFSLQAAWSNFDEGGQKRYVLLLSDISHRVEKEREMVDENAELERRVRERTHDLESVNRELTAFSYSISHDLREPIRAINGLSHILIEDYKEDQKPEAQEIMDRIQKNAMRMNGMIDSLLKLSRLTNTQFEIEDICISELARKAFAAAVPDDCRKKVKLVTQDGLFAYCDANLMMIALQNLIGNAWKFNKDAQDLVIHFGAEEHDGTVCYYVRDNGIGFRQETQRDIFKPFTRLNTEIEGEGIGLATVQRIISRHQGRVWAESELEQGCTIWFSLGESARIVP